MPEWIPFPLNYAVRGAQLGDPGGLRNPLIWSSLYAAGQYMRRRRQSHYSFDAQNPHEYQQFMEQYNQLGITRGNPNIRFNPNEQTRYTENAVVHNALQTPLFYNGQRITTEHPFTLPSHLPSMPGRRPNPYSSRNQSAFKRRRFNAMARAFPGGLSGRIRRNVGYYKLKSLGEAKFLDTTLANAAGSTTATNTQATGSFNLVAQGTAENERIGRTILVEKLYIKGRFESTAGGASSADTVRLVIYIDHQTNGVATPSADLFETNNSVYTFQNLANSGRFTILKDLFFSMNDYVNDTDINSFSSSQVPFKFSKRLNCKIQFNSTTGAIAEIESNNIHAMMINQNANVKFDGTARIRYRDN